MNLSPRLSVIILSLAGLLTGCADSSAIITGRLHPATTPDKVQLYLQPPAGKYETIGLVSATNNGRLSITRQAKTDAAIRVLKEKAAKIGANGVILQQQGTEDASTVGMVSRGTFVAGTYKLISVSGTAIFLP